MRELSLAISPCPNDIYIFGAWILGVCPEFEPARCCFAFEDVDVLNQAAEAGTYDVIKVSSAKALLLGDKYRVLSAGAAYGFGDGPKLVRLQGRDKPVRSIAVPGLETTAATLLRSALARPESRPGTPELDAKPELRVLRYDAIVPAILQGQVDAGLLIHETALVPARYGLEILLDMGAWWKSQHGELPLPLGAILAAKRLGPELHQAIAAQIRASLAVARANARAIWPLVKLMAREIDDATLNAHIEAYVSELSAEMGGQGKMALLELGRAMGLAENKILASH